MTTVPERIKRDARITRMAHDGMRPEAIASELGVGVKTVLNSLSRMGVKYIHKNQLGIDKRFPRKMWEEGDPLPDADDEKNVAELKAIAKELQSGRTNDNNLW
jgi:transposase